MGTNERAPYLPRSCCLDGKVNEDKNIAWVEPVPPGRESIGEQGGTDSHTLIAHPRETNQQHHTCSVAEWLHMHYAVSKGHFQKWSHLLSQLEVREFHPVSKPFRLVASSISRTCTLVIRSHLGDPSLS